jgi:hypothetical protein
VLRVFVLLVGATEIDVGVSLVRRPRCDLGVALDGGGEVARHGGGDGVQIKSLARGQHRAIRGELVDSQQLVLRAVEVIEFGERLSERGVCERVLVIRRDGTLEVFARLPVRALAHEIDAALISILCFRCGLVRACAPQATRAPEGEDEERGDAERGEDRETRSAQVLGEGRQRASLRHGLVAASHALREQLTVRRAFLSRVAKRRDELVRRLVAIFGSLGERLQDDAVERARQAGIELRGRRRIDVDDLRGDLDDRAPGKCRTTRDALVEQRAEREEIAARVNRPTACLFGRQIKRRADHHVAARHGTLQGLRLRRAESLVLRADELRQPEVQNLHLAALVDDDVRRLDVAMDDPDAMRFP